MGWGRRTRSQDTLASLMRPCAVQHSHVTAAGAGALGRGWDRGRGLTGCEAERVHHKEGD